MARIGTGWMGKDDGMDFPIWYSNDLYLSCPPPVLDGIYMELLYQSWSLQPELYHLFCCPKLLIYMWRKIMLIGCYFHFYVDHWKPWKNADIHESLLVGLYLTLLHLSPWSYRDTKSVLELVTKLSQMSKLKKYLKALFCTNFCFSKGGSPPYRNVWFISCYQRFDSEEFQINTPLDDDGDFMYDDPCDENRYK